MFRRSQFNACLLAVLALLASGTSRLLAQPAEPPPGQSRPQLLAQLGHSDWVYAAAFSADGKFLLTGSEDYTARLWDVASGREVLRIPDQGDPVEPVAISPDGRALLTVSGGLIRLWDPRTGKQLREFTGSAAAFLPDKPRLLVASGGSVRLWDWPTGQALQEYAGVGQDISALAVSSDGKLALTGDRAGVGFLWRLDGGEVLQKLTGHERGIRRAEFSRDGKLALTTGGDDTVRLWNLATGTQLQKFPKTGSNASHLAAWSPDGKSVVTATDEGAIVFDVASGKELRRLVVADDRVEAVAYSPDGQHILTGQNRAVATLWDAATGRQVRQFGGAISQVVRIAAAANGRWLLVGHSDQTAHLWDLAGGRLQSRMAGYTGAFLPDSQSLVVQADRHTVEWRNLATGELLGKFRGRSLAVAPDGLSLATADHETATVSLWDLKTGRELRTLAADEVQEIIFTGDNRHLVTVSFKPNFGLEVSTIGLWEVATGKLVRKFDRGGGCTVACSADSRLLAIAGWNPTPGGGVRDFAIQLQSTLSGRELRWFGVHDLLITELAFTPDGHALLASSVNRTGSLWETATGRELRRLSGHLDRVNTASLLGDGRLAATGASDGTVRVWNCATGQEECQLMGFRDGGWAVVDPAGRFDASNGGDTGGLYWLVGGEPIELAQLKDRYYDPHLLAKRLGLSQEPLRDVAAFVAPALFPAVQLAEIQGSDHRYRVRLTNRGGGIGKLVVKINGKEQSADARPRGFDASSAELVLDLDLASDPRLRPGESNTIEVQAYNGEGYLASRGLQIVAPPRGSARGQRAPALWAIVAGVSDYGGDAIDLQYAARDAEAFAGALRLAAGRLLGESNVHLTLLTTHAAAGERPTKASLTRALAAAQAAGPSDVLLVYLAGHGINHGGQDGDFHFLTAEASSAAITDPAIRQQTTLTSEELTEFIKQIPALKQVLILDTCASGRLVEKLTDRREVPSSQVRAVERMKDRTGMHVIAGCAADAVSYEATRYGQGVLTYSLLLGMRGGKLRENQFVDVADLFQFAADTVPELARDIGGIQRPVLASPKGGGSFDIGQVTLADRERIPLQRVRPIVLQSNFQDEEQFDDVLKLSVAVDERLRNVSARGEKGAVVFIDAKDFPDAHRLVGRYRVAGEKVEVTVNVFRGRQRLSGFTVTGKPSGLPALVSEIVSQSQALLDAPSMPPPPRDK
ncbi:MAG: caspase family protein [Pirellulaceae bacterium]|nr:caspase family protein [Pirellulaceae bacterium]